MKNRVLFFEFYLLQSNIICIAEQKIKHLQLDLAKYFEWEYLLLRKSQYRL